MRMQQTFFNFIWIGLAALTATPFFSTVWSTVSHRFLMSLATNCLIRSVLNNTQRWKKKGRENKTFTRLFLLDTNSCFPVTDGACYHSSILSKAAAPAQLQVLPVEGQNLKYNLPMGLQTLASSRCCSTSSDMMTLLLIFSSGPISSMYGQSSGLVDFPVLLIVACFRALTLCTFSGSRSSESS